MGCSANFRRVADGQELYSHGRKMTIPDRLLSSKRFVKVNQSLDTRMHIQLAFGNLTIPRSHLLSQNRILRQGINPLSQCLNIAGRHKESVESILDHIRNTTDWGSDDRQPCRHGFEYRKR